MTLTVGELYDIYLYTLNGQDVVADIVGNISHGEVMLYSRNIVLVVKISDKLTCKFIQRKDISDKWELVVIERNKGE